MLLGRLRTGQVAVRIGCQCNDKRKDVDHVLLRCSLTQDLRSQAERTLGVKKLSKVDLLYTEKGYEWAEKIWKRFGEEMQ